MWLYLVICVSVFITSFSAGVPPKLADHVPQRSQDIGSKLRLFCSLEQSSQGENTFEWLKNERPLAGSRYRIESHPDESSLTISKLSSEDSGNYSCFVRTSEGLTTQQSTILVVKGLSLGDCHHFAFTSMCGAIVLKKLDGSGFFCWVRVCAYSLG